MEVLFGKIFASPVVKKGQQLKNRFFGMKHEPVQIVGVGQNGKHLKFDEEAYERIIERNSEKGIEQLCVLSVAGKKRTGKSFLLSILLRYLTGKGKDDWMKKDIPLDEGFAWRGGHIGHTMGIWAWDELFTIKSGDGTKIGIMLIDTQGTFDLATHSLQTSHVFAISTLISSILVYNVKSDISLDDLQHLQLFVSLASVPVSKQLDENAPFQSLVFLVRDWVHTRDHSFGEKGGKDYWEYVKNTANDEDCRDPKKHGLMEGIKSSFQKLSCYLMPSPGPEVTENPDFKLLSTIKRDEFLDHLDKLTSMLLADPIPKRIGGTLMSPSLLGESLKTYTELFNGDDFPEPPNIAEATADIFNRGVSDRAIAVYEEKMEARCSRGSGYLLEDALQDLHSKSRDESVGFHSRQHKMILSGQSEIDLERMFCDRIERVFENYCSINDGNRGNSAFRNLKQMLSRVFMDYRRFLRRGFEFTDEIDTRTPIETGQTGGEVATENDSRTMTETGQTGGEVATGNDNRTITETVLHTENMVAADDLPAAANDTTSPFELWKGNASLIIAMFLVYCFIMYTMPFLQSVLVFVVGERGAMLVHLVFFAIQCQRLLTFLTGARMI